MKTEIILDLTDVTAKKDSHLAIENSNQLTNLEDIRNGAGKPYATIEKNAFLLDGNKRILVEGLNQNIGYCSANLSNEAGMFENPIHLTINFDIYHTSAGITIVFGDDSYCNDLDITYWSDSKKVFESKYNPTSQIAYLDKNVVENYNKIEITFYSTNIPYRYLKIFDIIYGFEKVFSDAEIESANSDHSINILSSELRVSTLDFSIVDKSSNFNVVNPQGYYKDMQENQKVSVYEHLDDKKIFVGNFYLTEWSNPSVAKADFQAQDIIGVLDNYTYYGGLHKNVLAKTIIEKIMEIADITDYIIEDECADINISGYMPISTCREALQQILFIIGCACNTSGVESLRIYKPQNTVVDSFIEDNRKEVDTTEVELNQKITGIEFSLSNYALKEELKELAKGYLSGVTRVTFNKPIDPSSIVLTNCDLIEASYNYAIIVCNIDKEYKIHAFEYEETQTSMLIQRLTKENIKENILTVKENKLINSDNLTQIADRIFNLYNATYKTTVDIGGDTEQLGDFISVNTFNNFKLLGNITGISSDLKGGFKQNVTIDNAILKQGTTVYSYTGVYCGYVGIREGV